MTIESDHILAGTVSFYNAARGYGFISPDDGSRDVFVHATVLEASGLSALTEGQKVRFEMQPDHRGPRAVNLHAA